MILRILIVDDEALARAGLRHYLGAHGDVQILGECRNGREAVAAIVEQQPDLVFLDINMPGEDGFDVLAALDDEAAPLVVFLTAHAEHASQAFRVAALDYLLKPLDPTQLAQSLQRARDAISQRHLLQQGRAWASALSASASANSATSLEQQTSADTSAITSRTSNSKHPESNNPPASAADPHDNHSAVRNAPVQISGERLLIRDGATLHIVTPASVLWIAAAGDYALIHANEKLLVRETMGALETLLTPLGFARLHRSAIVNLAQISRVQALDNGDHEVLLLSGEKLKLSRNFRDGLLARLSTM